jgi:cbb3-type cytochrome oxidase subunit 3
MTFDAKSDFQIDVSPSTWLKPYRNNSIKHVLKMAVFYHLLALFLMFLVTSTFFAYDPSHEIPLYPLTLIDLTTAGPLEESVFFGLPYFLTGNQYVMLGTGIVWALGHIGGFDEDGHFSEEWLTWENLTFVIPTMFFSYRAWLSGKGWLSIVLHSIWNAGMFGIDCVSGFGECAIYESGFEGMVYSIALLLGSTILLGLTYWAYVKRKQKNYKSNISKLQSSARKLLDEKQTETSETEKRCTNCNRLLSQETVKDVCRSCENDELPH